MICTQLDSALKPLLSGYEQVCVIADRTILNSQLSILHSQFSTLNCLWLEVSEEKKNIGTVQTIWDFLFAQGLTRRALVVCVGGGVLTDMAGFAAATYKRGVDYIAVPTTLLSMVDASTGGKTGFNYHGLKNGIGVFAEPVETLIWPEWLRTLPPKQFLSGFAEMLKTALVTPDSQRSFWPSLLQYDLERMDVAQIAPLIALCVDAKERIVAQDPKEEGLRKVLNFGHTFGHALEEISILNSQLSIPSDRAARQRILNSPLLHGYAVLYGMIAELYLSVTRLGCPKEPLQQLTQLMFHTYGRPECRCSDRESLIALMQQDKKNERAAEINCTLLRSVGQPVVNQVITPSDAAEAWDYLFSL